MTRINLWSSPRNISTALMYAFAQRSDTTVVDEPLYAYYLSNTPSEAAHPATQAILRSQSSDGEAVVRDVLLGDHYPTEVAVFKQMTHHLLQLDRSFLTSCQNVLLIRNPRRILASFNQVIDQPSLYDVGIEQQMELLEWLLENNALHAVVDSKRLLLNPEGVLRSLSAKLGLDFQPAMLQWPAGPRPEDGCWAPYWYGNVHKSTGFAPYQEKDLTLPPELEALAQRAQPIYEQLLAHAIEAPVREAP